VTRRRHLLALPALLLAACMPGVSPAYAQIRLVDDRGARIELPAPPRRIVTLLPSLTESVCALGACGQLVGTDRYSNWPRDVLALPKLGGLDDAQIERIVALKPDVVLAGPSTRALDRLAALGQTVMVVRAETHDDVRRSLQRIASLLGRPGDGDRAWVRIDEQIAAAAQRVPTSARGRRVYFEIDTAPYAAGEASFIGQTLVRLGLANAVPGSLGPFPKLNPEWVVRAQPDLIVATEQTLLDMPRRPGWSGLRALQTGAQCGYASSRFELLIRPGPRMGEAAQMLVDCLRGLAEKERP
jgi:iron complex transport system substrate-binding protein